MDDVQGNVVCAQRHRELPCHTRIAEAVMVVEQPSRRSSEGVILTLYEKRVVNQNTARPSVRKIAQSAMSKVRLKRLLSNASI